MPTTDFSAQVQRLEQCAARAKEFRRDLDWVGRNAPTRRRENAVEIADALDALGDDLDAVRLAAVDRSTP